MLPKYVLGEMKYVCIAYSNSRNIKSLEQQQLSFSYIFISSWKTNAVKENMLSYAVVNISYHMTSTEM